MNKSILIRGSIIMGLFLAIIGAAVGCSMIQKDDAEPQISNKEDVYLTLTDFDITNQELWEIMRNVDGIDYLMEYMDELVLADYISEITQDEIDNEVILLTYKTDDEEILETIQEDPELEAGFVDAFRQNMIVRGYDPDSADDLRSFTELNIAKKNMAKDYILDAQAGSTYELLEDDIKSYYEFVYFNDACAVTVRFSSPAEASAVFDKFNIVPNYNLGLGEYFGPVDIELVSAGDFNNLNTTQLNDDQVFTKYIELYNYMNPWMPQIPTDITQADYCIDYSDVAINVQKDLIGNSEAGDPNIEYANYLFGTLDLENQETIPYSYNVQSIGDQSLLVYKVSQEVRTDFEDLTAHKIAELRDELIDLYITDDLITNIMSELYLEEGLEIFDPILKLQYQFNFGVEYDNDGDSSIIATFGDTDITADDLYTFMEARIGTFYSAEISKVKRIILSDEYEEVYGSSRDYMKNTSDKMKEHRDDLRDMKTIFGSNGYAQYGFSSSTYSWEDFLYLAFGATSENQALELLYAIGTLQPVFIYPSLNYDSVAPYMQEQIDNYYSLRVDHALIFVDFDNDFKPDSFDDLLASLDANELIEYNALKVAFEDLIIDKYTNDEMSLADIVIEYKDGLIDDVDNEWAQFKAYGFQIMSETLSLQDDQGNPIYTLNYLNSSTLDQNFINSLQRIYNAYTETQNTLRPEYVDDRLTVTDFGLHFIVAAKGDGFDQPTALLSVEDAEGFTDGSQGQTMLPSESQFDIYNEIKFAEIQNAQADGMLPSSVYAALDAYYLSVFNAYFGQTGYSLNTIEYMLSGSLVFGTNSSESILFLEDILEALYSINFPEGFVRP